MTTIAADLLPTKTIEIAEPTPEEVALAHDALPGILDRYGGEAGRVPRPDFMDASGVLLRAHAHATLPVNAARWASLPASELDPGLLPILRTLAIGSRSVAAELVSHDDTQTERKVPLDVVVAATAERTRIMRYLEYQLGDVPKLAAELAGIRAGTGHLDLETDMRRLAVFVSKNQALLQPDKNRKPDDDKTCLRWANTIARELAKTTSSPTDWSDRLWAAMRAVYADEIRPAAEWLYRKSPSDLEFYPTIFVGFGRPRGAASETVDAPVTPPPGPATPATPATPG